MAPTRSGDLRHRLAFDKREDVNPDSPMDLGNTQSEFVEQFRVFGKVAAKFGGEAVLAARLIGQTTVIITVRQSSNTELVDTGWRARDVNEEVEYAIRSIVDPDDSGAFFEILAQTGVAQ